jgi:putative nucleotidyltransferase with HDIG domain
MKLYSDEELAEILDQEIFHQISAAADRLGVECYVVGGYVRDIFLERPSNDIDVVVVGKPHPLTPSPTGEGETRVSVGIAVAKELKRMLGRKAHLSVFKNFGTAQVKVYLSSPDGKHGNEAPSGAVGGALSSPSGAVGGALEVEFVGARRESYSHDSRKPIVEDGTLEDDQNRRDFTINAMAICLNRDRFGELVDPFNGLADLEDGIIATPLDPDITFSDDPLRMMRCIRFATQLNFQIEDATFEALERMADRIRIVSGERIEVELNKIIMSPHPSRGFVDLQRSGLLNIILPELAALDIVEQKQGRAHKNNFYHTLEVLENVAAPPSSPEGDTNVLHGNEAPSGAVGGALWLRWSALLHDIGKTRTKRWEPAVGWTFHNHNYIGAKMVPEIFRRLKLPMGAEMKYVQKLVDLHMRPQAIADSEVTDSAVRRLLNDAGDDIDDLMTLCEADITSKNEVKKKIFLENFRMVREKLADLKVKDYKRLLQPVIDGNEIMELFGLQPSREVGTLKQFLKDAVLDNRVENEREPLMQLLMEKARQMGLTATMKQ